MSSMCMYAFEERVTRLGHAADSEWEETSTRAHNIDLDGKIFISLSAFFSRWLPTNS